VLVATKFLAATLHSLYVKGRSQTFWKGRSWSGNFGKVGVGVRQFTSDSATPDAILERWSLLAWPWWCNRIFVTGIFLLITNSQWGSDLASFQANLSHLILLPENRLHFGR